jgi:hypothetical protein
MRSVILVVVALALAVVHYAAVTAHSGGPDLCLALAAWVTVAGEQERSLIRLWLIGMVQDLIDPGTMVFHSLFAVAGGLLFWPLRPYFFHSMIGGWMLWAGALVLLRGLLSLPDGGVSQLPLLSTMLWTAVTAVALGWSLSILPGPLHPLGVARA